MIQKIIKLAEDSPATLKLIAPDGQSASYNREPWSPKKRKLALILPGGSYKYISEREGEPVALHFLKAGYATAILNYRVDKESGYPNPLIDIFRAMNYLNDHAEEIKIDPGNILVVGFSAGGHLAAMLGATFNSSLALEWGFDPQELKPKALVLAYPLLSLREESKQAIKKAADLFGDFIKNYEDRVDPLNLIHEDFPPSFIFTTLEDDLIRPYDTLLFLEEALRLNLQVEFHLFDKGGHGLASADDLANYGRNYPKRVGMWIPIMLK